ncbi:hypothetical protein AAKU64_000368 [Undibacterium sp. GrIS 1.8]|uniref:hypothetical protein n=1 Tax=Undibacterium sp. GrIS 1.8 TaxID=3143934 RepID=UPI00339B3FA5
MQSLPPFFSQYELADDADERAIKRTYARQLKTIDQEVDPTAFQTLREAYEYALSWIRHRDWQLTQEQAHISDEPVVQEVLNNEMTSHSIQAAAHELSTPIEVLPLAKDDSTTDLPTESISTALHAGTSDVLLNDTPTDVAKQIFDQLMEQIHNSQDGKGDALEMLSKTLEDERLINVETHHIFEWGMASYLAQGWQKGNGNLFGAASKCFGWDKDKQRVFSLGEHAYLLDNALTELAMFNEKEMKLRDKQLEIILKVRNGVQPSDAYLRANLPMLIHMIEVYPYWLPLVTDMGAAQQWLARGNKLGIKKKEDRVQSDAKSNKWEIGGRTAFFIIIALVQLIRACGTGFGH